MVIKELKKIDARLNFYMAQKSIRLNVSDYLLKRGYVSYDEYTFIKKGCDDSMSLLKYFLGGVESDEVGHRLEYRSCERIGILVFGIKSHLNKKQD